MWNNDGTKTDRPTDISAGDDIVKEIFEKSTESTETAGKEVILYLFLFFMRI
jgi:hypothetical protein